jgi:hypothetical protein
MFGFTKDLKKYDLSSDELEKCEFAKFTLDNGTIKYVVWGNGTYKIPDGITTISKPKIIFFHPSHPLSLSY